MSSAKSLYLLGFLVLVDCGGGGGGASATLPPAMALAGAQAAASPTATMVPTAVATTVPTTRPTTGPNGVATTAPTTAPTTVATMVATTIPAVAPTVAPTAVPTAAPLISTSVLFQNPSGEPASFTPWSSSSPLNQPISANPTLLANSAAIVAAQFPSGQNPDGARVTEAGQYDYEHPVFFASAADPLVTLHCMQYCNAPDNGGVPAAIHIPAKARPAAGTDAHMTVVQADGTTVDFFALTGTPGHAGGQSSYPNPPQRATRDWQTGDTAYASSISNCGVFGSGVGILAVGPGPTAADFCNRGGTVTAAELLSGQINHAVDIVGPCAVGAQYPAAAGASTQQCTSGLGPPLGGRMWYDVPCATTRASGTLQPWEKGVLCALNIYGGYLMDDEGGGANFTGSVFPEPESEEPWYDYNGPGYTSPFAALAGQGWNAGTIANANGTASGTRWAYNYDNPWNPSGVSFAQHIHWLAACSAQGSC